ncbi:MAG: T9SS type A sorting domain-containing protein [Flavobacteriales bacterium]
MIKALLPLLIGTFVLPAYAQVEGNVWQFGNHAGLRFQECDALALDDGQNDGFEGCATISNAISGLLFYTNGETVWNRAHQAMPFGTITNSGGTLSQVLIVRQPLSDSLFCILTTMIQAQGTLSLMYHIVDMALDNGMGDVASAANILTTATITETVTVARHGNGTDVWVLAHEYPSNSFLAYLLTSTGLSPNPVVSAVGPSFATCNSNMNARGEMKFNLAGDRLAMTANGEGVNDATNLLALFDFDPFTGIVSNPLQLPYGRGDFGVSFSPDGSKLYGSTWKAFNFTGNDVNLLYQFDLSSSDSATIANSRIVLDTGAITEPFGSVQLGPDGRIYIARQSSGFLGVVNNPDMPGSACDYVRDGMYLAGKTCNFGLNNYLQYVNCNLSTALANAPPGTVGPLFFPNPSTGGITICNALIGEGNIRAIRIVDGTGRVLRILSPQAGPTFDLSDLAAGTYVLALLDAHNSTTISKVLVIQR